MHAEMHAACFLDPVINVRSLLPSLRACRQARKLHVFAGSGLTSEALGSTGVHAAELNNQVAAGLADERVPGAAGAVLLQARPPAHPTNPNPNPKWG